MNGMLFFSTSGILLVCVSCLKHSKHMVINLVLYPYSITSPLLIRMRCEKTIASEATTKLYSEN